MLPQSILSKSILPLVIGASLMLAGCGVTSGIGQVPSQSSVSATALKDRSSFEEAIRASQTMAEAIAKKPMALATADGHGIGKDGRLLSDQQFHQVFPDPHQQPFRGKPAWNFLFIPASEARYKPLQVLEIRVDATGKLQANSKANRPVGTEGWLVDLSSTISLQRAIGVALADGLKGQVFEIDYGHATIHEGKSTYVGPLDITVSQEVAPVNGSGSFDSRTVLARSGRIAGKYTQQELEQVRPAVVAEYTRWHHLMTGGSERPVTLDDLIRFKLPVEMAKQVMKAFDSNGDNQLTLSEFLAGGTSDYSLQGWRQYTLELQMRRADCNHDERLSQAEALKATLVVVGPQEDEHAWPLNITAQEFGVADRNRDGFLDIAEYVPLGVKKTVEIINRDDEAVRALAGVNETAIPWSH